MAGFKNGRGSRSKEGRDSREVGVQAGGEGEDTRRREGRAPRKERRNKEM